VSRQIHCQLCRTIHLRFKFGNLHPLLRFLANSEICFRGRASTLTLKITYQYRLNFQVEEDISVRRYAKHAMSEMKWFASQLYAVHLAIQMCGIGNDLISSPACTRLVVLDYKVPNHYRDLHNEIGIALKVTVVAMVKRLASCYYTHVSHARSCVRQWSEEEDTMRLNAGFSQQSWDRKLRLRIETVSIYEEAGLRLHAIMQDLWRAPR
jgi:hypothetical protein